jgi:hypothetical protein
MVFSLPTGRKSPSRETAEVGAATISRPSASPDSATQIAATGSDNLVHVLLVFVDKSVGIIV